MHLFHSGFKHNIISSFYQRSELTFTIDIRAIRAGRIIRVIRAIRSGLFVCCL